MFFVLLAFIIFGFPGCLPLLTTKAHRNIPFDHYIEAKKLRDPNTLEVLQVNGVTPCALQCSKHPLCISFTLCPGRPKTCELNRLDLFSTNVSLEEHQNCAYYGMRRNQKVKCSEMGAEKDIREDSSPGFCKINRKRMDAKLEEKFEEALEVNTADEWKRTEVKQCHLAAHGGIEHCSANETKVLEWYKFVHEESFFPESREKCLAWGGELFYGVNGTKEQLDFFYFKLEPLRCFWTGIQKDWAANKWVTPVGDKIDDDLLVWGSQGSQPDNSRGNEGYVKGWKTWSENKIDYLHDNPPNVHNCKAVCQRVS